MQIIRQTDYAIRCVLYLSRMRERVVVVDDIAVIMDIPKSFLAKILQRLTKAGIVKSSRGIKGGFQLAKKPRQISLLDIIEAIQGPAGMNRCAINKDICRFSNTCTVHPVWVELRQKVEQHLKKVTFQKLIKLK
jgi:Rrf2 family protein